MKFILDELKISALEDLFQMTDYYGLEDKDFVVVGSAVMNYHGIRPSDDIDIIVSDRVYPELVSKMEENRKKVEAGESSFCSPKNVNVLAYGVMTVLAEMPINAIIDDDRYYMVSRCGIRFVRPELSYMAKMKAALGFDNSHRPRFKDYYDVSAWTMYFESNGWNSWLLPDELMETINLKSQAKFLMRMPKPVLVRKMAYFEGGAFLKADKWWPNHKNINLSEMLQGRQRPA